MSRNNKAQEIIGKKIVDVVGPDVEEHIFLIFSDKTCARLCIGGKFYGEPLSEGMEVFVVYPVSMEDAMAFKKQIERNIKDSAKAYKD